MVLEFVLADVKDASIVSAAHGQVVQIDPCTSVLWLQELLEHECQTKQSMSRTMGWLDMVA
jgi:hypothetical protein